MDRLKHDWITDGIIDFEYKKYVLLAYLKQVKRKFGRGKLYPQLADLFLHYNNLQRLQRNKQLLLDRFPREMTKIDPRKLEAVYRQIMEDGELMEEIDSLIAYALPQMEAAMNEGKQIYDFVENNLHVETVGLVPIYDREGYLFLAEDQQRDLMIFRYEVSIFESANERYRSIKTEFLEEQKRGLARTVEQVKLELMRKFKALPNPATFLITSKLSFPTFETLLPIAKRMVIQRIEA